MSDTPTPDEDPSAAEPEAAQDKTVSGEADAPEPAQANAAGGETGDVAGNAAGNAAGDGAAATDALKAEVADLKDKLLRAMAEVENIRRRAEKERGDAARYGAANLARDMLGVADNLRRAIETVAGETRDGALEETKALIEGVEVTERALLAAFDRHKIQPIAPEIGARFDPNLHEAMFEVPGTGQPSGTVVQVVEQGYMIFDRLLRAARVGVAKDETPGGHVDTKV